MKKLILLIGLLLVAVICAAGCTSTPSNPSTDPTAIPGGPVQYTISSDGAVTTYEITLENGAAVGNQKIVYPDNYHSYDAALVNDIVPKIIKQYQNNPITIYPDGNAVEFTLKSTEAVETVNGEKLVITAVSATEVYQNGIPIDTKYFTQ